jgi:hypothetical protein
MRFENACVYDEETYLLLDYGIEDKHYKLNATGQAERLPGYQTTEELNAVGIGLGKEFGLISYTYDFRTKYAETPELRTLKEKYWGEGKIFPTKFPESFSVNKTDFGFKDANGEDVNTKYSERLPKWDSFFYDVVLGKKAPSDFDKYVADWYAAGGQEIIDIATKNNYAEYTKN